MELIHMTKDRVLTSVERLFDDNNLKEWRRGIHTHHPRMSTPTMPSIRSNEYKAQQTIDEKSHHSVLLLLL